ncbi:MAG: AsmA-like C-terminal region-containing protein [Bacteroidota bacterium]
MKKVLIVLAVFVVVLFGIILIVPVLFKDQIKATIDEQIEANVNADVLFDIDNFSVSLLKNFPNFTASIEELGVIGRDEFSGETLFAVEEMDIEVSIGKLIFGDQLSIQGIVLVDPQIFIKVLEDGSANYDIAVSTGEEEEIDTTATDEFSFAIEHWSMTNGHIIYDDATLPMYLEMENVDHSGSGDFTLSIFDLDTKTSAFLKDVSYDGDSYLENKNIDLDMILNMDIDQFKFTFKENEARINDFAFGFDGWLSMPAEDIDMDITFDTHNNTFKSLMSLIPGMYSEDFGDLKSSGTVAFDGYVKGTYNETSMPAYKVNLLVEEGMFQYPDLPEAVSNVAVNMLVESKDGNIDNTLIDISKFHIDFGQEPFDGHMRIENLVNYPVDMQLKTTLNLANLSKLFPIEGLEEMSGIFKADFKANGVYDSITSEIPKIDAVMSLTDGNIKYIDLPAPLNDINVTTTIKNESGVLNDTELKISSFNMDLDGLPISGSLLVDNLDDYHWDMTLEGDLDFDKLFPIINKMSPMPGTTIGGKIAAHFRTAGKMSDVDNENYDRISNSGSFDFNNFTYTDSVYLPMGMNISSGSFAFNPKEMVVSTLQMNVGKSDFKAEGKITNYIKYIFNDDETIFGNLAISSNKVDLNEFMTEEVEDEEAEEDSEPYTVIEVPENIDFVMQADMKQIIYDDLVLNDAVGEIIVRDGVVNLNNLATSTLGGKIVFNGNYDTRDMEKPSFDMGLDVSNIEIKQSYNTFNTIQALAPIAKNLDGNASTNFSLSGILKEDMMPDLGTISGAGLIEVLNAQLSGSKLVTGLTSNFKGGDKENLALKDIIMNVSIEDGKLNVKPFDLKINNYNANVGGSTSLDGLLDYDLKLDVPAGNLGSQANALLGSLTGSENTSDVIKLNFGIGGTYDDPKVNLLGTDAKDIAKQAVTDKATDLVKDNTGVDIPTSKEELNKEAIAKARKEADNILAEAQKQADQVKLEAKKAADKMRAEAQVQYDRLIEEAGSNPIKKKAAEITGKKALEAANNKADKIEAEGDNKADAIMATAQEKADTLIKNAESK